MLVACLCVGPVGCATFSKRSGGSEHAKAGSDKGKPAAPVEASDPLVNHASAPALSGFVTGRVMDIDINRLADAYVRYECVDDKAEPPGDVEAKGGFFKIEKLKPGRQYKLTARTKQGEKLLAGTSYVTAPDIYVLIKMSERYASANTPPLPPPPGVPDKATEPKDTKKAAAGERPASATAPSWEPGFGSRPADKSIIGILPPVPMRPEETATTPQQDPRYPKNLVDIPGGQRPAWDRRPEPGPTPAIPNGGGAANVPSCSLLGNQLRDLVLPEVSGATWQWSVNRRGKVVLLDFWYTTCLPCRDTIDVLRSFQAKYGYAGLEVVGIACERSGTFQQQAYNVATLCRLKQTNYRLLIAGGERNPVPEQFDIHSFPTLVLLDESGTILWRHIGALRSDDVRWLEAQIERRLGVGKQ
jgi:thiol-disulfide isomerase/thioredoxin